MEIVLYIAVLSLIILYIIKCIKKNSINTLVATLTVVSFTYLFIPIVVFIFGEKYTYKYAILANIYRASTNERLVMLSYIVVFLVIMILIYNNCSKKVEVESKIANSEYIENKISTKLKISFNVLFIVGFISFLYLLYEFKGITGLLSYTGAARGEGELTIGAGSVVAYMNILARSILGCMPILITVYMINKRKFNIINRTVIVLVFMFSLIYLIFNAGRLQILIFFIPLILFIVNKYFKGKKAIKIYMLIFLLILVIMPELDNLFYYLTYNKSLASFKTEWSIMDNLIGVINSFTYPFSNLLLSENMNNEYGLRFGVDYILPFINIIPTRILNIVELEKIQTLYSITSEYYKSSVIGFNNSGGVPNDLISLAIRQFSFVGLIISGAIMGIILKYFDILISKIYKIGDKYNYIIYTDIMVVVIILLLEPYSAIMAYFPIFICLGLTRYIYNSYRGKSLDKENKL